jgi:ankyrin repeat protein
MKLRFIPVTLPMLMLMLMLAGSAGAANLLQTWQQAIKRNQLEVIAELLPRIGNVDQPADNGKTALMASARDGALALSKALISAGADVNAANNNGGTALMFAAASGDAQTTSLLLQQDAAVNAQSSNGWSALTMAAVKNHLAVAQQLIGHGADVNLPDIYGWTPLMRAVYEHRTGIVKLLLTQAGIELERLNDHGQTALHLAVIQGYEDIAALLLENGAQQDADFAGHTPRTIAQTLKNEKMLALLARYAN